MSYAAELEPIPPYVTCVLVAMLIAAFYVISKGM
jgi:hypothetical protein